MGELGKITAEDERISLQQRVILVQCETSEWTMSACISSAVQHQEFAATVFVDRTEVDTPNSGRVSTPLCPKSRGEQERWRRRAMLPGDHVFQNLSYADNKLCDGR